MKTPQLPIPFPESPIELVYLHPDGVMLRPTGVKGLWRLQDIDADGNARWFGPHYLLKTALKRISRLRRAALRPDLPWTILRATRPIGEEPLRAREPSWE